MGGQRQPRPRSRCDAGQGGIHVAMNCCCELLQDPSPFNQTESETWRPACRVIMHRLDRFPFSGPTTARWISKGPGECVRHTWAPSSPDLQDAPCAGHSCDDLSRSMQGQAASGAAGVSRTAAAVPMPALSGLHGLYGPNAPNSLRGRTNLRNAPVSLRSGSKETTAALTLGLEGSLISRCSSTSFRPRLYT